jgi:hypothetical protein
MDRMRTAACLALVLLPLVSVLACGGRFDGNIPDGGGRSSSSSGSTGGGSGSSSGGQGCPAPANVTPNAACTPDGLTCPSDQTISNCGGSPTTVDCTCQDNQWVCEEGGSGGCPGPVCPPAQDVVPSMGCKLPDTLACESATPSYNSCGDVDGYLQCRCNAGQWACLALATQPCADGGASCPPPTSIHAGWPCMASGTTCPGNPTQCNGQTDYDAFQCESGAWVDVAQTVCAVDAGVSD